MTYTMRSPCRFGCGTTEGRIETRSGQDCVYCLDCGRHQYNAPKVETGREPRKVSRSEIKPAVRARIFDRAGGRCEMCGQSPASHGVILHVGHVISCDLAMQYGMSESEANCEENLMSMCEECNLGYGNCPIPARLLVQLVLARNAYTNGVNRNG